MAGFAETVRGNGLVRADWALAALAGDPLRLDHERQRFNDSPPPHISDRSGTTTRSVSSNPLSEEQLNRQERLVELGRERENSKPYDQFKHQAWDERNRIFEATLDGTYPIRAGEDFYELASEYVKKRWVEQGIWKNSWYEFADGLWKHEEPLELESQSETDSEAENPPFSFAHPWPPPPKPRRPPKSDEEKQRIAERRVIREREREASRPYHQFIYQISKEREGIQVESANVENVNADVKPNADDINTRAYENIKKLWTKRGIWNKKWGVLPGMSWKHEEPLDVDGDPLLANPVENSSHEVREASSKASKATGKRKGLQRPPRKATSDVFLWSSSMDTAEPQPSPDCATPRKSKRIQTHISRDLKRTASTGPPKRTARSKPGRNIAGSLTVGSSAKPQGISKKEPAKPTKAKGRGK